VIQLAPEGLQGSLSEVEVRSLREQFDAQHCLKLPGLLAPRSVALMQEFVEEIPFIHRVHGKIGTEFCLPDGRAARLMFFLVNDPALFAIIRRITGCPHIGCFTGRVYRMVPGAGDYDTWHSDIIQERMVGMSINIGPAYEGGVFQLRECGSQRMLGEAPNVVPGDAILFRIDPTLEHWITPMTGTTPKTAFAGWFRGSPEFMTLMDRDGLPPLAEPEW
jgi:hypothetical protein